MKQGAGSSNGGFPLEFVFQTFLGVRHDSEPAAVALPEEGAGFRRPDAFAFCDRSEKLDGLFILLVSEKSRCDLVVAFHLCEGQVLASQVKMKCGIDCPDDGAQAGERQKGVPRHDPRLPDAGGEGDAAARGYSFTRRAAPGPQ